MGASVEAVLFALDLEGEGEVVSLSLDGLEDEEFMISQCSRYVAWTKVTGRRHWTPDSCRKQLHQAQSHRSAKKPACHLIPPSGRLSI